MPGAETNEVESRDLLTAQEVAGRLSMSVRTLWRMIERGKFPAPIRYTRRLVRWKKSDLLDWLGRQRPTS
jgi:excisionase family DNA binding protein